MSGSDSEGDNDRRKGKVTALDLQRAKLKRLMDHPEKPASIPDRPKDWKPQEAPDFVRFYMGSSAGAGSEVYHVYRHLRQRENTRQQWIADEAAKEDKDQEFQERLAKKRSEAEKRTAKKRAKRLKRKEQQKSKKLLAPAAAASKPETESDSDHSEEADNAHFVIGGR